MKRKHSKYQKYHVKSARAGTVRGFDLKRKYADYGPEGRGTDRYTESAARGEKKTEITGTFSAAKRGFGFVTPDDHAGGRDIFIPRAYRRGAWDGDHVRIAVSGEGKGRRPEGAVIGILERHTKELVGTLRKHGGFSFVIPDLKNGPRTVHVRNQKAAGAGNGDKVVVSVTDYGDAPDLDPSGEVMEILGHEGDPGLDIFAVARGLDIPMAFGERELRQAERCPDAVSDADAAGREDLRSWQLVTIDGPDAKDLDDAVSLAESPEGYTLGVHIADVSHYVPEGSPLDREALKRGTSVYLADRVIPMLPEKLSNGICSLNAGEDRLALSVIMTLDRSGKVTDHYITESVIRVGERMSYPDVRAIIEDHDAALMERYRDYVPLFERMLRVSKLIRSRRRKRGAVDFDFPEAKAVLDENGFPVEIVPEERNAATGIIEDFMLTANETVAEDFRKKQIPFLYRVHENPDPDKIEELLAFVRRQGVPAEKRKQKITPREIQLILKSVEGKPNEALISRVVLRSMQRAAYSTACSGHFALAAKYYCHFTSPIRRYPDLQIHRIIHETLRGEMTEERKAHYDEILKRVAVRCSVTERRADEAERETLKLKEVQYMSRHIGETFEGLISGVTGWGLYVELPNTIEGLVPVSTMCDDYYSFDEEQYSLTGRLSGRTYTMGDPVRVRVTAADEDERTIDFELD